MIRGLLYQAGVLGVTDPDPRHVIGQAGHLDQSHALDLHIGLFESVVHCTLSLFIECDVTRDWYLFLHNINPCIAEIFL